MPVTAAIPEISGHRASPMPASVENRDRPRAGDQGAATRSYGTPTGRDGPGRGGRGRGRSLRGRARSRAYTSTPTHTASGNSVAACEHTQHTLRLTNTASSKRLRNSAMPAAGTAARRLARAGLHAPTRARGRGRALPCAPRASIPRVCTRVHIHARTVARSLARTHARTHIHTWMHPCKSRLTQRARPDTELLGWPTWPG